MEETDEFKWAVKLVLKRQMKDLVQQLHEQGEEIAVLDVNLKEETSSYFGTRLGEWFLSEQKTVVNGFKNFCKLNEKKKGPLVKQATTGSVSVSGTKVTASNKKPEITVQDTPTVKISIPKNMSVDVTEHEMGGLVGRIIASQMSFNKEKGDGSSGGTKFDSLVETLNLKNKGTPVRSTRSGRRVTNKYLDSIRESATKRGRMVKSEDEDSANDAETQTEDTTVVDQLSEIDVASLKKVQVTAGGKNLDLQRTVLVNLERLELVAASVIKELHNSSMGNLSKKNLVKVIVKIIEEEGDQVKLEITGGLSKKIKTEFNEMDDSDMECSDFVGDMDLEEDEEEEEFDELQEMDKSDVDIQGNFAVPFNTTPKQAVGMHGTPAKYTPNSGNKLVRKKKYQKPLSERMPMECEHCGQYVAGKSNLKSHIRRVHLKVKNHKCTICQKGFWSNNALESHMLSVHTRRCDNCQEYVVESVPWGSGIDMRMKRDVICTCGSIVSIYSSFGRRRQYLRDDEPDENGDIPTKTKSNAGTKYACGTCGKLFMKKSNCERHSRAHSDLKSVVCNICGSAFSYENSLKRHMETEHGIIKHACDVCGKNYSNETALKVHYIKAHAQQNMNIGDNLVMIVKEKPGNDTADLEEQMEEIMEGEADDDNEVEVENSGMPHAERIVVTRRPDGSTEQHIMVTGPQELVVSGSQELIVNEESHLLGAQADIGQLEEGQVMVTQGEGGQVHVTTGDPGLTQDSAQRIVQQAIQEGHMVAQDGSMSIIIKQLPMSQVPMSQ